MFVIRAEQMKAFAEDALLRFEDEMVDHSKDFSPRLCDVLGDEQLRVALRAAMSRAATYGFTYRGPIRLFIELMFLCGSAFDTDPQYPELGKVLRAPYHQMQRAEQIHEGIGNYIDKVSGPGAVNVHNALKALSKYVQEPLLPTPGSFVPHLIHEMNKLFPLKAAYVGEEGLTTLIQEGREEARKYGFPSVRSEVMMVILMFSFGHGCLDDPLYPWISRTLRDQRIVDPAAKAARLEKRAITWLRHVIAGNDKRAEA